MCVLIDIIISMTSDVDLMNQAPAMMMMMKRKVLSKMWTLTMIMN